MTSICTFTGCNKEFTPSRGSTGKFCSQSCAAKTNNRSFPKRASLRPDLFCQTCETKLTLKQFSYCSTTCSAQGRKAKKIKSWLAGEWDGSDRNGDLSGAIRNYLIQQAGNRCPACGWGVPNPYINKVILTVDHKDGKSNNNHPENLYVLCYNCHTLTSTFCALNKGNGTRYTPGQQAADIRRGGEDRTPDDRV